MPSYVKLKTLPVRLTGEEMIAASKELTKCLNDLDQAESKLENFKKMQKAETGKIESQIQIERVKIQTGEDFREVECMVDISVKDHTKTVTRMDTGEIINTSKLNNDDLQYQLDFARKDKERKEE